MIRTLLAQSFTLGNLAHKVGLLLLQVGGETLILGCLDSLLDHFALLSTVGLGLLLHGLGEALVVALQGFAEVGVGLTLVVKVSGVSYLNEIRQFGFNEGMFVSFFGERCAAEKSDGFLPSTPVMIAPAEAATKTEVLIMK